MNPVKLREHLMKDNFTSILTLLEVLYKRAIEQELLLNEIKIILSRKSQETEEQSSMNAVDFLHQSNQEESQEPANDNNTAINETSSEHSDEITCFDCMQSFVRGSGEFTRHLHSTACKPYQCDICGKLFKKKSNMGCHKLTHSVDIFSCDQCGAQFKCQKYLNNHIGRKHNKPSTSSIAINPAIKREAALDINEYERSAKKAKYNSPSSSLTNVDQMKNELLPEKSQYGSGSKTENGLPIKKVHFDLAASSSEINHEYSATSSSESEYVSENIKDV